MKLFPSKSDPVPSRSQALQCIPKRNDTIHWEELEDGSILFTYPLPLSPFFLSLYKRFGKNRGGAPTKKLQLDTLGSYVWQQIDGKRSVKEIISDFAKSRNITLQEAEHGVTAFLKSLGQRELIALH